MKKDLLIAVIFLLLSFAIFRNYFLKNQIPLSASLLVSFYEPWKSYQWEGFSMGVPNKPLGFDSLRIFYPIRHIAVEQAMRGQLPLWNPYSFSGNTLLGTYQSAIFHPLSPLFLILPQVEAWSWVVILQPFFAMLFMYAFLRELLKDRKSSFFGALAFGLSGFMIAGWEESFMSVYSALFLPLVLLGIEKLSKKTSILPFTLLVGGITFSILSGWFQSSFYVYLFSFIYFLFKLFTKKLQRKSTLLIILGFTLPVVICAIHLLPNIESYLYSARGNTDAKFLFDQYLLPLQNIITLFIPDFFGNPATYNYYGKGFYYEKVLFLAIPAIIAGIIALFLKSKSKEQTFFKLSFIISLSLGFALPTSWLLLYHLHLPFVSTILPSRIFFLTTFSLSALSAYGIKSYEKDLKWRHLLIVFSICVAIISIAAGLILEEKYIIRSRELNYLVSIKNSLIPSVAMFVTLAALFMGWKLKKIRKFIYLFLCFLLVSLTFYSANKYLSFSERRYVFPELPLISEIKERAGDARVWSFGQGAISSNLLSYYDIQSPEGYDSIFIKRYGELLHMGLHKKFDRNISRADALLPRVDDVEEFPDNTNRVKLLSLLGVKYIVTKNTQRDLLFMKNEAFKKLWSDDKYSLYQYENAYPRAILVSSFIIKKNDEEIATSVFDIKNDLSKMVILEEQPSKISTTATGTATISHYSASEIKIETKTNGEMILFLSDNYYPGWNAYINGKKSKILRANYSFRGVEVPGGDSVVVFKYEPLSFAIGLWLTAGGIVFFVAVLLLLKRKKLS